MSKPAQSFHSFTLRTPAAVVGALALTVLAACAPRPRAASM